MLKFLTAKWHNLIMANYAVDPRLLDDRVPHGTVLDFNEGKCFVSLVGFMFRDTRVMGIPVPFHINFEEINLRFYVKRELDDEIRRGVVFVKELVPRWAIAFVARTLYGEPYEAVPMRHDESRNRFAYSFLKAGREQTMLVETGKNLGVPGDDSHGSFIIEHYWGYTKRGGDRTHEYRVEHPKWELHAVDHFEIDLDFGITYGPDFTFLNEQKPHSVVFAKGSAIAVYKGKSIK
jgi:uncharacterized protein YqjF (DUF2071 family)